MKVNSHSTNKRHKIQLKQHIFIQSHSIENDMDSHLYKSKTPRGMSTNQLSSMELRKQMYKSFNTSFVIKTPPSLSQETISVWTVHFSG